MKMAPSEEMKWNGWGNPAVEFDHASRPKLWPWIRATLGVDPALRHSPARFEAQHFAPSRIPAPVLRGLENLLGYENVKADALSRFLRSTGKSFADLHRARAGKLRNLCDAVALPEDHEQVVELLAFCARNNLAVIPFGGGTNIVGALSVDSSRPTLAIDLRRMNRLLALNPESSTALFQAGVKGPRLESALSERGYSLGHFPDSFEYSTLGGWIATRSAGMQSDAYGRIEDMVVSLKVATPKGTFWSRDFPASSMGPDLQRVFVGSEGQLGVITEALMKVHPRPEAQQVRAYLFRTFREGSAALKECRLAGIKASMMRLQDEDETHLAFHLKEKKPFLASLVEMPFKKLLLWRGYRRPALLVVGYEGTRLQAKHARIEVEAILRKHSAAALGASIGKLWSRNKYDMPYIRDFIMDHECVADVAETGVPWDRVDHLYAGVRKTVLDRFARDGISGYLGCHISHTYVNGACLYFTFAFPSPDWGDLEWYYRYKRIVTDAIVAHGGTASHHHAVGTEHRPWLEQEMAPLGLELLATIKGTMDPGNLMNPGKFFQGSGAMAAASSLAGAEAVFPQGPSAHA